MIDPLDEIVHASLVGAHAHLARRSGRVLAYPREISTMAALPRDPTAADWRAFAELIPAGGTALLASAGPRIDHPPAGWRVLFDREGLQLVPTERLRPRPEPEAVPLGRDDVPEILDLVERTRPGPFRPRTIEFGGYLGVRREGRLIAMAGQRLRPGDWTEISAVCTDPAHRGQGLAGRLTLAVAHDIRERGGRPMLHLFADNAPALRLYTGLGLAVRRSFSFAEVGPTAR